MMSDVYCGQGLDIDIAMAMCSFYLTLFIYVVMATILSFKVFLGLGGKFMIYFHFSTNRKLVTLASILHISPCPTVCTTSVSHDQCSLLTHFSSFTMNSTPFLRCS